jgi:putative membrane protein
MEFRMDHFVNAVVYAALGIVIYMVAFFVIDKATPGDLHTEIFQKHNIAAAIVVGFMMLGIGIIIASAVH